eukprot:CAMPEP_0170211864 /NCGR_PEP_ID=MMETSP0116_2-20130129/5550_1 /TAXON_ID=400756 /ORGANISM="Durinskia baltica, Strain CSIRO CS-38" /LENGTH=219 /DNA_ID=CAMNT_0010462403 /DNA_START=274 /DNA_END=929 /DNA_ORIENTATION=-
MACRPIAPAATAQNHARFIATVLRRGNEVAVGLSPTCPFVAAGADVPTGAEVRVVAVVSGEATGILNTPKVIVVCLGVDRDEAIGFGTCRIRMPGPISVGLVRREAQLGMEEQHQWSRARCRPILSTIACRHPGELDEVLSRCRGSELWFLRFEAPVTIHDTRLTPRRGISLGGGKTTMRGIASAKRSSQVHCARMASCLGLQAPQEGTGLGRHRCNNL